MRDGTNTEAGLVLWAAVVQIAPLHTRERSLVNAHGKGVSHCQVCKLSAALCDAPNTLEHHRVLGFACYACRDTADVAAKILLMLAVAPSWQLSQQHIARRLGRRAMSLNRAFVELRRNGLIENAYKTLHEKPSSTTYKLTEAGKTGTEYLRHTAAVISKK